MLGKIFGSQARVKILKIFLAHPDEKFFIRGLARDLKLQINSVRRELENLEEFGLLTSKIEEKDGQAEVVDDNSIEGFLLSNAKKEMKKGKKKVDSIAKTDKKFFKINKDFVLFEEIKALVLKAQILYEEDFVKQLEKVGQPKLLILAGFFVNDPESRIDMFLVGRFNREKLLKLIKDLEEELGREINYTIMDTREFKYRRDITDVFLYDILERKKIMAIDEFGIS